MITVFKTSVKTKTQIKVLKPHIDKMLPKGKWNFDLEDCDRILRIDSEKDMVLTLKELLEYYNHSCEELT